MSDSKITRRSALVKGAAAVAAFNIVPRHVLGGQGYTPPSEIPTRAIIGCGGMARNHMGYKGPIVAICDVDRKRLESGKELCKKKGHKVEMYEDFREMIKRPDVDIVSVDTPPHWHGLQAIAAANAGKDVWCEKPFTRTIGEGKELVKAVHRNGRMLRINTWFRFKSNYYSLGVPARTLKKVVDSGMLGWPLTIRVGKNTGTPWKLGMWSGKTNLQEEQVPDHFNYDMWLGPAPYKPYNSHRTHGTFRGYWDYDGGGMGDMGQHFLDPVQYILDKDDESPIEIEADTDRQHYDAVLPWRQVVMKYKDGCKIIFDETGGARQPFIEGPKGKIYPGFQSDIPNFRKKVNQLPEPAPVITDFYQSVREHKQFALNEENGHRSATLINLAKIALRLNRKLYYDSDKQLFINDAEANRFIDQPMRGPWNLHAGRI